MLQSSASSRWRSSSRWYKRWSRIQNSCEELMHLQWPTRERRSASSGECIAFLQEHKENQTLMQDDPFNFLYTMCYHISEEEYPILDNKVWEHFHPKKTLVGEYGYLRLKRIQAKMWRDLRLA